ncbi:hypothetical protein [Clostridium oryzae]|uniref:Class I SAM-dependent methyltransferase n=1 Tax=Clostridium oryzae TaxID=1450648 RepID=A0A1V4IHU6_9CLOT|nr:hypothetical protein [Clostridium oryzae]OPJ59572.1 hypothetical protein CLORY_32190 [Clostridium oryzae]
MVNIDIEKVKIEGNVLDIGSINYGIVYRICKELDNAVEVDYVSEDRQNIKTNFYDTAIIFFNVSNLAFESERKDLIKEAAKCLSTDGEIIIWDVEKKRGKKVNTDVNMIFKSGDNRIVNIRRNNIFTSNSLSSTKTLIEGFFDIIEENQIENIFFIRAKKKENTL